MRRGSGRPANPVRNDGSAVFESFAVGLFVVAGVIALLVARALRTRAARAAGSPPPPAHWLDRSLRGAVILAPFLAALAVLLGSHVALADA